MPKYEEVYPFESKSTQSPGFRYFTEAERDAADEFFARNADALPSQRSGEFIGEHAICYIGNNRLLARLIEKYGTVQPKDETRPTEAEIKRAIRKHGFTPRQQEIIRLLARGKSEEDISAALGISQTTVRRWFDEIRSRIY